MTDRGQYDIERRTLRIRSVRRDLDEELAFHFEETVEELMSEGMPRCDAEHEARRRFGEKTHYRERLVAIDRETANLQQWRIRLDSAHGALRHALRAVRRSPVLSAGIVLAFALGIGANAAMYGTIDRLFLRPPDHIRDAASVKRLWREVADPVTRERQNNPFFTYPDYQDFRVVSSFSAVAAYHGREMTLSERLDARRVQAQLATASYWDVLGVTPALGRFFDEEDDVRGGEPVAVLSYGLWQRDFGGTAGVLGQSIDLGEGPHTIIGVAPKGFTGPELAPVDVWLPLHRTAHEIQGSDWVDARMWWWVGVIARLAPDATVESAAAEATAFHRNGRREVLAQGAEASDPNILPASLIAARGPNPAPESAVARWLAAVSLIVLLIACANVANLLLARAIRRQRETGIRLALGISRSRLVGQMLTEGLVLALLGAAAALIVTHWGGAFLQRTLLPDVAWGAPLRGPVLTFVMVIALLAGTIAALPPALQATALATANALRGSAGGIQVSAPRLRALLSGTQAALSVVLLVGAGLFVRSLNRVQELNLGLDAQRVLFVQPDFRGIPGEERLQVLEYAREALSRLPSVERVAVSELIPFRGAMATEVRPEGMDSFPALGSEYPWLQKVSPDYFGAMGLDIRRGRGFEESDREGAPQVVVIDESMAERIWPGQDALGRCLYIGETDPPVTDCTRIVGVVENVHRHNLRDQTNQLMYYVPIAQEIAPERTGEGALLVRALGAPARIAPVILRSVLDTDARLRFADVRPLQELLDPQLRSWKLGATMFTIFGVLALIIAALGLYSILSFDVAQRTREIGLRTALGAGRRSILTMFVRRAVQLTMVGTAVGLVAALFFAPRLQELLFETSARDPVVIGTVIFVLVSVAVLAGSIPAWRAAKLDPNVALRAD